MLRGNEYTPTCDEIAVAKLVARIRHTKNFGGSNIPGGEWMSNEARFLQEVRAVASEIAVSHYYNLCWTGCGKGSEGLLDVGDCLEVRSVPDRYRGLLSRPKDSPELPCVLVEVQPKNPQQLDEQFKRLKQMQASGKAVTLEELMAMKMEFKCLLLGWEYYGTVQTKGDPLDEDTDRPCRILDRKRLRSMDTFNPLYWKRIPRPSKRARVRHDEGPSLFGEDHD